MKLTFKDITVRNFLSFGNVPQTVKLDDTLFRVFVGMNKDKGDNPDNRNGSGKSSLLNAIHYALFGKSIGNTVNLGTLVNNINKKNMEVTLNFEKDGVSYSIERGRSPNFLRFYKNGDEITDESLGDSRDTQDEIKRVIGMNEDVFTQIILLSCFVPLFLRQSSSNQKSIIEKILGIDIIGKKVEVLKSLIKETKNTFNNEQFKYITLLQQYDDMLASLNKQEEDMNIAKENRLSKLKQDLAMELIKYEQNKDFNAEKEIESFNLLQNYLNAMEVIDQQKQIKTSLENKIIECDKNILQCKTYIANNPLDYEAEKSIFDRNSQKLLEQEKYKSVEMIYNMNVMSLKTETDNFMKLSNKLKSKEKELSEFKDDVCPTCGQTVNVEITKQFKEKLEQEIRDLKGEIHQSDIKILELNNEVQSFKVQTFDLEKSRFSSLEALMNEQHNIQQLFSMIDNLTEEKQKNELELSKLIINDLNIEKPQSNYSSLEEIMEKKNAIDIIKTNINSLNNQIKENPFEQQENSIKELKNKLVEPSDETLKLLEEEMLNQDMLLKLLNSPSSFIRKTILDKSLEYLNNKISSYLIKLGSDIIVTFNNDMSITFTKMNVEYGYVSSGEEGRLSLALMLAFRDVWESLNNCEVNLLLIDELIDREGLDTMGVNMFINTLQENESKNIMLVTHNKDLINQAEDILLFEKENGFTEIKG